ncbi:MAG: hypothetical protein M0P61_10055 [Ignavibacteriaceae bacterium]|nr:hypothetical protein [Ignavibacteriaceae bacterium]
MLEKITNINLRSEYFSGKKATAVYKNSLRSGILKNDLHDSVNISPAYRFLSQVDWKLKEMTNVTSDKIFVAFYFSGYEFQTTLDLSSPAKLNLLEYNVIKDSAEKNPGTTITATLSVNINKLNIEPVDVLTELRGMKIFFNRLSSLNLKEELNFNNNILFELFDGILGMINKEFDYLNSSLFAFIEKMLNIKMLNHSLAQVGLVGLDSLNKIKLLNVDVRKN